MFLLVLWNQVIIELMPSQQFFSYIMQGEHVMFWWDNDNTELEFYSSLKQQSSQTHVHTLSWANQFLLLDLLPLLLHS